MTRLLSFSKKHRNSSSNEERLSSLLLSLAEEINNLEFNYDPRYLLHPQRTPAASHYAPLATNERYPLENYSTPRPAGVNLIRQNSYISAVRAAHPNDQGEFGKERKRIYFYIYICLYPIAFLLSA